MGIVSLLRSVIGSSDSIEEPKIVSNFNTLQTLLNGNLDYNNLATAAGLRAAQLDPAILQALGLNDGTTVRRGKSVISASGTRTNTAFGALDNGPDVVRGIVLPTDGLIAVSYKATWQESVSGAGFAAIFLGANQLQALTSAGGNGLQCARTAAGSPNIDRILTSSMVGLVTAGQAAGNAAADVTTGQVAGLIGDTLGVTYGIGSFGVRSGDDGLGAGGVVLIEAAAGTYDVSVQFKSSSGSVTVKNRRLRVWAEGF